MLQGAKALLEAVLDLAKPIEIKLEPGKREHRLVRDGYRFEAVDTRWQERNHVVGDLPSLVAYLKRHGKAKETTVFAGDAFVAVLRDNTDPNDASGRVTFRPQLTEEVRFWQALANRGLMPHVDFREAIEVRGADVVGEEFVAAVQQFQARSEVKYDADLDDDSRKVAFVVLQKAGGRGTARLPRSIEVEIPVHLGREDVTYTFEFRLRWEMCENGPVLGVTAVGWDKVMQVAGDKLIEDCAADLGSGWLVVRGAPAMAALRDGTSSRSR